MGGVFIVGDDGVLVEAKQEPFASESVLQELIAKHPRLLSGNADASGRWLLVEREAGIADQATAGARWALDHLFLDQQGVPTLVEVKRQSDSRIRREVVGQMLDYAANAVVYLPVEDIRANLQARCSAEGCNMHDLVAEHVQGAFPDADTFWNAVKTNLQAGRIRLVFVADIIPPELARIVEFLNEQMDPAEVIAIELLHYRAAGLRTLVPRLIGQTASATLRKRASGRRVWTEDEVLAQLGGLGGDAVRVSTQELIEWARREGFSVWWGAGAIHASAVIGLPGPERRPLITIYDWTERVHVELSAQANSLPPFSTVEARAAFRQKISAAVEQEIEDRAKATFPFVALLVPDRASRLREALLWALRAAGPV